MDELERLRRLGDEAPAPDPARKAQARRELLALARQEAAAPAGGEQAAEPPPASRVARLGRGVRERRTPVLAAAAMLVLLGGIAGVGFGLLGETEAPSRRPRPEAGVPLGAACTHPEGRFEVRYPDEWHASDGCEIFDTEPLDDAVGGPFLGIVTMSVVDMTMEEALTADEAMDAVRTEEVVVDGRPAVRRLRESTGEVLPEGHLRYTYYVDLGDTTLVASTDLDPDGDPEERRDILDAMMASLDIPGPQ